MARSKSVPPAIPAPAKRSFKYFQKSYPEYQSVIVQGNPFMTFLGSFPVGLEFYNQERLGHEFGFEGVRDPFFSSDLGVQLGKRYQRGYILSLRQKFYNEASFGMWYFGHNIRYAQINHFINEINQPIPASAEELRFEYGLLLGNRLMQRNDGNGFTIDAFIGAGVGFRNINVDPAFEPEFSSLKSKGTLPVFQFGLNFGYSLSFDRK